MLIEYLGYHLLFITYYLLFIILLLLLIYYIIQIKLSLKLL